MAPQVPDAAHNTALKNAGALAHLRALITDAVITWAIRQCEAASLPGSLAESEDGLSSLLPAPGMNEKGFMRC
jgi:hypothetical protein